MRRRLRSTCQTVRGWLRASLIIFMSTFRARRSVGRSERDLVVELAAPAAERSLLVHGGAGRTGVDVALGSVAALAHERSAAAPAVVAAVVARDGPQDAPVRQHLRAHPLHVRVGREAHDGDLLAVHDQLPGHVLATLALLEPQGTQLAVTVVLVR